MKTIKSVFLILIISSAAVNSYTITFFSLWDVPPLEYPILTTVARMLGVIGAR